MSQTKVPTKDSLTRRRVVTISDLLVKAENEDWHGVADAAMDLREIDVMLDVMNDIERRTFNYPTQEQQKQANASQYVARTDRYEFHDGTVDEKNTDPESRVMKAR